MYVNAGRGVEARPKPPQINKFFSFYNFFSEGHSTRHWLSLNIFRQASERPSSQLLIAMSMSLCEHSGRRRRCRRATTAGRSRRQRRGSPTLPLPLLLLVGDLYLGAPLPTYAIRDVEAVDGKKQPNRERRIYRG